MYFKKGKLHKIFGCIDFDIVSVEYTEVFLKSINNKKIFTIKKG